MYPCNFVFILYKSFNIENDVFFIVFLDFNLILIFINSTFSYISRLSTLFLLPFWFKSSFTILKPSNHSMLFLLDLMIMMMITTFNDENWNFFICCRLNVKWKFQTLPKIFFITLFSSSCCAYCCDIWINL